MSTDTILTMLLIILSVMDIYTTHLILKEGGRELNHFLAFLFRKFNAPFVMIVSKGVVIASFVWAMENGHDISHSAIAIIILSIICVMSNAFQIMKGTFQK